MNIKHLICDHHMSAANHSLIAG